MEEASDDSAMVIPRSGVQKRPPYTDTGITTIDEMKPNQPQANRRMMIAVIGRDSSPM